MIKLPLWGVYVLWRRNCVPHTWDTSTFVPLLPTMQQAKYLRHEHVTFSGSETTVNLACCIFTSFSLILCWRSQGLSRSKMFGLVQKISTTNASFALKWKAGCTLYFYYLISRCVVICSDSWTNTKYWGVPNTWFYFNYCAQVSVVT